MPISNKCSTCGAPVPDKTAVFCNRCGSRLPAATEAEVLTCEVCQKAVTDRQSRFCDRCGSPLAPAVPAAPPATRAVIRRNCPSCGFGNFGENLFYCRKCGAILPKYEPVTTSRPGAKAPSGRPQQGGISIIPDGMDEFRQQDPVNAPGAARHPSVDTPVALRRQPAYKKTETLIPPRKPLQEVPKQRDTGSYRKVAIIAAVIMLLLLIVAAIVLVAPGFLNPGSANTTDEDTTIGETTDEDAIDEDTIDEDTIDEDTIDEDTIDEDTIDEDTIDEDTIDEDTIDEDTIDEDSTIGDTTDSDLFRALSGVIIPAPGVRDTPDPKCLLIPERLPSKLAFLFSGLHARKNPREFFF